MSSADSVLFQNHIFEPFFQEYHQSSNSLGPDQARYVFGLDLGPNCLQMLLTYDTSRQ